MTTETQVPAGRRVPGRPGEDFVSLFPELYRSAFTAAHSELGSRGAAEEVTHTTLARAHARWSRIGDAPVGWVSMAARTQALQVLQRQPPGREVLLDEELELAPGEIPGPAPGDLASVTRRGKWLRRRRAASWAAAAASVVAVAGLAVGLGTWTPPSREASTALPTPAPAVSLPVADYSPIIGNEPGPDLLAGRISAGRSERGSVRVTFEPRDRWLTLDPATGEVLSDRSGASAAGQPREQQLVIDPSAALQTRRHAAKGRDSLVNRTPEELVQHLNRSTPGGQAEVLVRLGPDGKVSALREE